MSYGLSLGLIQRPMLTQHQVLDQRLAQRLDLRQELLAVIYDDGRLIYHPNATCPKPGCGHKLTAVEILRGFRPVPTDPTTCCPKCKTRFQARLLASGGLATVEIWFLCPCQTLSQLRFWQSEGKRWEDLEKGQLGVYRSALIHFGSLKAALKQIGVDNYEEPPIQGWQAKIRPFLGRLPDAMIAKTVRQPARKVRSFRLQLGIATCDRKYDVEDDE